MQHADPVRTIEKLLRGCGFGDAPQAMPFDFDDVTVPIAAFAGKPWDSWSACLTVVNSGGDAREAARRVRPLGAVASFVYDNDGVQWWSQGAREPIEPRAYSWTQFESVIEHHKAELHPDRIYGAKLNKPGSNASQLWFFDAGLMPAVEADRGRAMTGLIEDAIAGLRSTLGAARLKSRQAQEDMYRTTFWLLAAKILHDKRVPSFIRINLTDVDEVFDRIGKHYGDTGRLPPFGKSGRPAIDHAAASIARCGSLRDVSSESLAYVYENTLIEKAAGAQGRKKGAADYDIRQVLGIHGTPTVLINHMLSQLWPMIQEIPLEDRHVFEPACGHAPFLTAAMRWLRDDVKSSASRHHYLRNHLHGLEKDPFSVELARLSLTLADEPHGNSWLIKRGDMFETGILAEGAAKARILLANPPYEPFSPDQRSAYEQSGHPVTALTKAVEMLNRTLPYLAPGGVFGVVLPQGVLHDRESRPIRELLLKECELKEIAVFADGLFEHGDHEVAVLLGRRRNAEASPNRTMYRRVRERGMEAFKERQTFSSEREVAQARFSTEDSSLLLPDLLAIWDYLASLGNLGSLVHIQKGREYWEEDVLKAQGLLSVEETPGWVPAILRADDEYPVWDLPRRVWIDPSDRTFRARGGGPSPGVAQVILNYNPVSREWWRLKPILDQRGLAVSSNFVVFRPTRPDMPLYVIWAILNSPLANAYAYAWSGKRHTLVKEWRAFPLPTISADSRRAIEVAVDRYFAIAREAETFMASVDRNTIRKALLAIDAEVLKAYDLPPRLERELLDQFREVPGPPKKNVRKGVGCEFQGYFPPEFRPYIPLHEYLSDAYHKSTAGEIVKDFQPVRSKAALDALELAGRLAGED